MPQLLSHLLIIFFVFRSIKIFLQEWGAWYVIFSYASLYTMCMLPLYNTYFFFFLQIEEVPNLTYFSRIILICTIQHGLFAYFLKYKADETTIIWIWSAIYGLNSRALVQLWKKTKRTLNYTYYYFLLQQNSYATHLLYYFWFFGRTFLWYFSWLTVIGWYQPEELTDTVSDLLQALSIMDQLELNLQISIAFTYWWCLWYYFKVNKVYLYADTYVPGIFYRYKFHYETPKNALISDCPNRYPWYSPKHLLRKHYIYFSATPQWVTPYLLISDIPHYLYIQRNYLCITHYLTYLYTHISTLREWVPTLLDFNTEQPKVSIFFNINIFNL